MKVKRKLFFLKAKNFPKLKAGNQVLEGGTHKCSVQQMNRQAHTRYNVTFKNPRDKERNLKRKSQRIQNTQITVHFNSCKTIKTGKRWNNALKHEEK